MDDMETRTEPVGPVRAAAADEDFFAELKEKLQRVNPRTFELMKISRRICLIRREDATEASGFLVGPDLMLTAAHALMGTAGIFADPDKVTILFDQFEWNLEKGTIAKGDSCGLRRIPFSRQPDVVASSIRTDPKCQRRHNDSRLDYVLVRLDRPMGLAFLPFSHRLRGWNDCSRADGPAEGVVRVVQHPAGGLQRVAEGFIPVDHVDPEFPQLFRYQTTALNGSSGSPIFDEQRRVVGMHVGERSTDEQLGISMQRIFADLEKQGVKLPPFRLSKEVMDSIFGSSRVERERHAGNDWRGDRLFDDIYASTSEAGDLRIVPSSACGGPRLTHERFVYRLLHAGRRLESHVKRLTIFLVLSAILIAAPLGADERNPLDALHFLLGTWNAVGEGKPGQANGASTFARALQGRVITRTSYADYPATEKRPASRHEDLMVIYADGDALRADYYDSEGHVIRYAVHAVGADRAVFTSDVVAGQPRYRLTYILQAPGKLDGTFEIAPPGQPEKFATYLTWTSRLAGR